MSRATYAAMFGPATGDRVRLADTELFSEVEKDFTIPGEEVKFGGGKVIRDGMGQSQLSRAAGVLDTVITNALILDHSGILHLLTSTLAGEVDRAGRGRERGSGNRGRSPLSRASRDLPRKGGGNLPHCRRAYFSRRASGTLGPDGGTRSSARPHAGDRRDET